MSTLSIRGSSNICRNYSSPRARLHRDRWFPRGTEAAPGLPEAPLDDALDGPWAGVLSARAVLAGTFGVLHGHLNGQTCAGEPPRLGHC